MDFYKRAALVLKKIPEGKVATYGQIALLCGKPEIPRQVGYGLGRNLMGEDVPAYKVVNAQGILSGAAAFETFDMQKLLLEQEGVEGPADGERLEGRSGPVSVEKYPGRGGSLPGRI